MPFPRRHWLALSLSTLLLSLAQAQTPAANLLNVSTSSARAARAHSPVITSSASGTSAGTAAKAALNFSWLARLARSFK